MQVGAAEASREWPQDQPPWLGLESLPCTTFFWALPQKEMSLATTQGLPANPVEKCICVAQGVGGGNHKNAPCRPPITAGSGGGAGGYDQGPSCCTPRPLGGGCSPSMAEWKMWDSFVRQFWLNGLPEGGELLRLDSKPGCFHASFPPCLLHAESELQRRRTAFSSRPSSLPISSDTGISSHNILAHLILHWHLLSRGSGLTQGEMETAGESFTVTTTLSSKLSKNKKL